LAPGVIVSDVDDNIMMSGKEGIGVMIDGKRVALAGKDLKAFLKSIPAENIDKIEIITNPSSKFDAQGNAGILNIRLKKNLNLGVNGSVGIDYQQGETQRGSLTSSINYRNDKINIYGYSAYHLGRYRTRMNFERTVPTPSGTAVFSQNSEHLDLWRDPTFRIGADYFLTPKSTIGAVGEFEKSTNGEESRSNIDVKGSARARVNSFNNSPSNRTWNKLNTSYRFADKLGSEFSIDIDYFKYVRNIESTLTNDIQNNLVNNQQFVSRFLTDAGITVFATKVDYTKQVKNMRIDIGAKFGSVQTKNNLAVSNFTESKYVDDFSKTNNFLYKEKISSAYFNYSNKMGKFGFQVGLRAENTDIDGVSTNLLGENINQPKANYFNLFPTAYVSYDGGNQQFRLSYGKRINRPDYNTLNPFVYQIDLYNSERGNPLLKPRYSDNYELAYTLNKSTSMVFGYHKSTDMFSSINRQIGIETIKTTENLGQEGNWSLSINTPIKFTSWWSSYSWITGFNNKYDGNFSERPFKSEGWGFSMYSSQNFSLPQKWSLELSGYYNSATRRTVFDEFGFGSINFAFQKKLMKDKAIFKLGFNDLFNMQRNRKTLDFEGLKYDILRTWENQQVLLEFRVNIGRAGIKKSQKRESADGDEKKRAGKANH
jgi:iron complex outermembrane recepter protein